MMNKNSIRSLATNASAAFIRFPAVLLCAVTASVALIFLHHFRNEALSQTAAMARLAMTAYLGMLLFLAASVHLERRRWSRAGSLAVFGACLLLLAAYYFSIDDVEGEKTWIRFVLFALGGHALIAFAPFWSRGEYNGFWQYNKSLFLRYLTSALYSSALYLGLALALLAVDQLFNADIGESWYFRLWVCTAGIFNTWFFLAGFPEKYGELEASREYPRGLKLFTQYVLLPLVTLYLGILYAYELKIFVTRHWPVGWVSYLVLGFSIAGILSLLLVWPVRNSEENTWIKGYSKFFYVALFPLIILLALAIGKRVAAYGITENRYFIIILAAWLACMAAYFLFSRNKNIKWLPISLCLLSFASSFGPWGAFSVSRNSQQGRLEALLSANHLLQDGNAIQPRGEVPDSVAKEVSSLVRYLLEVHGAATLQPYFAEPIDTGAMKAGMATGRELFSQRRSRVHALLGIPQWEVEAVPARTWRYSLDPSDAVPVSGYDFFGKIRVGEDAATDSLRQDGHLFGVDLERDKGVLVVSRDGAEYARFDIARHITGLNNRNTGDKTIPVSGMMMQTDGAERGITLVLLFVSGENDDNVPVINSLQAYLIAARR